MKKGIIVLTTSSLLIGSLSFVGAQGTQTQSTQSSGTETQTQDSSQPQTSLLQRVRGFGGGFGHRSGDGGGDDLGRGFRGLPFGRHLALGTTVTLSFYATNPANGEASTPEQTLDFTYGQDSEAAFAQSFAEARANASYITVSTGEQTQTLELPSTDASSEADDGHRRGGVYGALPLRGLNEGSSVEATFYDGDPAANGEATQTLTFTYGQDSEAGFASDFASASENAAYVTVTTSPQTNTVDLSTTPSGSDSFFDPGFSRDGSRRGGFGRGHSR